MMMPLTLKQFSSNCSVSIDDEDPSVLSFVSENSLFLSQASCCYTDFFLKKSKEIFMENVGRIKMCKQNWSSTNENKHNRTFN